MVFKRSFFLTLLVGFSVLAGFASGYLARAYLGGLDAEWPLFSEAYTILANNGLKELPPKPVIEYGMIRGLLQVYDEPYTRFVEPPQHELEGNALQGSFGGIGVRLGHDEAGFVLLYPFPGSPAEQAGIQDGDRLLSVGDLEILPQTPVDDIEAALRGPVGERVKIVVARSPDFSPQVYEITRREIPLPSVTWRLDAAEPRLGIIEINIIASSTPDEVLRAVEDLRSRGAQAFALDLRDNFGGLLSAGIETARLFLREGTVIQQQYKGREVETFSVEQPGSLADLPLVVFVNQHTASAAEIIAGALKAHGRAKVIGVPTFGKDTIQLIFDLQDGSSLHVTAAHWWVPGLEPDLSENGIQPDIPVPASESGPDPVLKAAAAELLGTK